MLGRNPNAPITEEQPFQLASRHITADEDGASRFSYEKNQYATATDWFNNVIDEPDRSNPTRSRHERPLDTIRSFELAVARDYGELAALDGGGRGAVSMRNSSHSAYHPAALSSQAHLHGPAGLSYYRSPPPPPQQQQQQQQQQQPFSGFRGYHGGAQTPPREDGYYFAAGRPTPPESYGGRDGYSDGAYQNPSSAASALADYPQTGSRVAPPLSPPATPKQMPVHKFSSGGENAVYRTPHEQKNGLNRFSWRRFKKAPSVGL